jgi:4-hydroxybutyryl-CoA dehydratase/vinylacetyl-CoA-Delta-isomerase
VVLIKEIGTEALCALMRVAADLDAKSGSGYAGRVDDFYKYCRSSDLAVAQTDGKGDRSLPPSAQQDPDLYVHIVDSRRDGIVVRARKLTRR